MTGGTEVRIDHVRLICGSATGAEARASLLVEGQADTVEDIRKFVADACDNHGRMVRDLAETQMELHKVQHSRVQMREALQAMFDTAMKCDDVAWRKAIDAAGTRTPLDFAKDALEGSTAWRSATLRKPR